MRKRFFGEGTFTYPIDFFYYFFFFFSPRVSSSLPSRRVLFLEEKGLTSSEIAEAFHRTHPSSPTNHIIQQAVKEGKKISDVLATQETTSSGGTGSSANTTSTPSLTTTATTTTPSSSSTTTQSYPPPG
jgi:hypothetical protein